MSRESSSRERSCSIDWCAETGLHERHQRTLGTWFGSTVDGDEGFTFQFVIYSNTERNVRPAVVFVNSRLEPVAVGLTWPDVLGLVAEVAIAARRFTDL